MPADIITCPNCSTRNRVPEGAGGKPVCSACWSPLKLMTVSPASSRPTPAPSGAGDSGGKGWIWFLLVCGIVAGLAAFNNSSNSTPSRPSAPANSPQAEAFKPAPSLLTPEPLINHGEVSNLTGHSSVAPFRVVTSGSGYYLVKLVDRVTGRDAFYLFVHGGRTAEVDVPLGNYELRYASGTTWYGIEHLFGSETVYSKSPTPMNFTFDGHSYSGNSVTLYLVRDGNMRTQRIRKAEF